MENVDDEDNPVVRRMKSWSEKGRTQQWRDKKKVLDSGTPNGILNAAAQVFYGRNQHAAGYVMKKLIDDPDETGMQR